MKLSKLFDFKLLENLAQSMGLEEASGRMSGRSLGSVLKMIGTAMMEGSAQMHSPNARLAKVHYDLCRRVIRDFGLEHLEVCRQPANSVIITYNIWRPQSEVKLLESIQEEARKNCQAEYRGREGQIGKIGRRPVFASYIKQ